ncbi:TPA: hypothetical protein MDX48_003328 [Klebsiella quasipneumoniae]|nr:hypothetical protein [Klebsiella quasipneumoniae]
MKRLFVLFGVAGIHPQTHQSSSTSPRRLSVSHGWIQQSHQRRAMAKNRLKQKDGRHIFRPCAKLILFSVLICHTAFAPPNFLQIKSAISDLQNDIEWYDREIAEHKKTLIPDAEHLAELVREKNDVEKSLRLAKSYLTKERNKRVTGKK